MGESHRKRRRDRSRSRPRSTSTSRDEHKKSRRRHSHARRSRSYSSDNSDRRSRSRSARRSDRDHDRSRGSSSRRDKHDKRTKERRHRSHSRSASRPRSSDKAHKRKHHRSRHHRSRSPSRSRSRSHSPHAAVQEATDARAEEKPLANRNESPATAAALTSNASSHSIDTVEAPRPLTNPVATVVPVPSPLPPQPPAVTAPPKRQSTADAPTTFKFNSIALKHNNNTNNNKPPTGLLSTTHKQQLTRLEKLAQWKQQQLERQRRSEAAQFLAEDDAVPPQLSLWSPADSERDVEKDAQQRERVQQVLEEVDPLDAYMAGLVDEAALQQSMAHPAANNVISFDELTNATHKMPKINIYSTFLPIDEPVAMDATVNSQVVTGKKTEETTDERDAREERELKEFMAALKQQRSLEADTTATKTDSKATDKDDKKKQGDDDEEDDDDVTIGKSSQDTGRIYQGFEEDAIGETAATIDTRSALEILQEAQKKKEIKAVDHSQIAYMAFQKKFYVVPKEIRDLTEEQVDAIRNADEIKIRGKSCPRPIHKWTHCGFSVRMLQLIQKHGYAEPFAIQRQALPAIMSGRDVIGIAKTGSGKTLAFLLPMFRHILHQPPLQDGEGPIGLIMAPARELAQQIYNEAKRFAKGLGMRATAVYGGSSVSEQIGNLKRGSDIVICTPGRMIDILSMSAGKVVTLKRVTYVVLDEADRMFDMGFEPQITKILLNIRADRQTLLFSATFPRAVETLARRVLKKPVEITVGGRSQASGDILQYVEVRDERDKFMRLLQLLGLWYERGNVLVFVNTQQACDHVFQELMKAGYPALSLHGGKDQVDRDYTIDDFKRKVRTLMVATSVAGRGLDVKDLVLVINYHCPNHLEDYVHRVGRTGRAGRKGTAYTFISPDEEEYAVDLVKALEAAKQVIPPELEALADGFIAKVQRGEARHHGSGFKGKGFTFDESERNESQRVMDLQKRQYEIDQGIVVEDAAGGGNDDDETDDGAKDALATSSNSDSLNPATASSTATAASKLPVDSASLSAIKKAQQIAQILDLQYKQTQANAAAAASASDDHFEDELEINDYPQQARWRVTQKEASDSISELTGAAVIARGSFVPAGRKPNPGERKLYLRIEGPTRAAVVDARREIQRILDETTLQVGLGNDKYGKYNL